MNQPQFADILNHPYDILAVISLDDFSIAACNNAFKDYYNKAENYIGRPIAHVIDHAIAEEKKKEIIETLESTGYYSKSDCLPNEVLSLTKLQISKNHFALMRVTPHREKSMINQYKLLFEKNVAGVYRTYFEGDIISCNLAFAQMLGYENEAELLAKSAYSHYPTKEDRDLFLQRIKENPVLVNFELQLKKKDGQIITCLENTFMEIDSQGQKIISGTIIDITEQKQAERALQESEQRFKTLANVSHESVVFIDSNRVIIDVNDQFAVLYGYFSRIDILGKKITDFIAPIDLDRIESSLMISAANKSEIRTFDRNGRPIFLEVTGTELTYKNERVKVLVLHDITAKKKAEFTLEQTAVRFKNLLENSPTAVIILTDDKIKYVNSSAIDLLGVEDEDEIYDDYFTDYIVDDYKLDIKNDLTAVREGEELDYKEIRIKNQRGQEVDVGILSTLTIYESKPSIQISLNNISERMQLVQEQMRVRIIEEINNVLKKEIEEHKQTQRKLEEQKNYNRNIIESSLDMIIACDENGNLIEFNKASQLQFGYEAEEVLGKPLEILYIDKESLFEVMDTLAWQGSYSGEVQNITKAGKVFTSYLSASLIVNDKGDVVGSMGVSRDITEIRANERKALEQKAKLESIFNSTENMMIWTMNKDRCITSLNNNLVKWAKSELKEDLRITTNIQNIFERHLEMDFYQGQLTFFDDAFKGKPRQFEIPLRSKDNKVIWLQAFLNPVYLDEKLEEVSCLFYDNTERKEIDRKIRDSLKEKEVLLQEVHHRVKNNLQVISSILNLQTSYVNDPGTLEILKESQNRIKSMSFIHETLYRTTDFSSINFSEYIKSLSYNLIQSYRLQNCHVDFVADVDEVEMSIDQAIPCGLIVNELVSNALKYAYTGRSKGKLAISLKEKNNRIFLQISDDGIGLPENFKFEKTDSLGVQLVYSLTEQLDGTIEVDASDGTSFLIIFDKRL
jgi:PAS domain S-box-containing protein